VPNSKEAATATTYATRTRTLRFLSFARTAAATTAKDDDGGGGDGHDDTTVSTQDKNVKKLSKKANDTNDTQSYEQQVAPTGR